MVAGVDQAAVSAWFGDHVPAAVPPLRFTAIAGGRSNLTYRVDDAGGHSWVLRRPPLSGVLPSAHDMAREYRIIAALGPTAVPVPGAVALCTDGAVTGAPFYVMEHVDGVVPRDEATVLAHFDEATRAAMSWSLVDALVELHRVRPEAVGLGGLGRPDGYIQRQLARWRRQWQQSRSRDLPAIDEVCDRLAARIPPQGPATIVHGDYRLDNVILSPAGQVRAVLDWELCTLGDPLADLGLLQVYWGEPGEPPLRLAGIAPTTLPGFPRRAELAEAYARASGRDLSDLGFYVAFGYWKLAVILEGVRARYAMGGYGEDRGPALADLVVRLVEQALAATTAAGR